MLCILLPLTLFLAKKKSEKQTCKNSGRLQSAFFPQQYKWQTFPRVEKPKQSHCSTSVHCTSTAGLSPLQRDLIFCQTCETTASPPSCPYLGGRYHYFVLLLCTKTEPHFCLPGEKIKHTASALTQWAHLVFSSLNISTRSFILGTCLPVTQMA